VEPAAAHDELLRRRLVGALLLSVLLIGLYDQSNDTFVPKYSSAKDRYTNDAAIVTAMDGELPPQARVFQLPYVPFPDGHHRDMQSYDLLRPYLHESDLRWSFGAVKGRPIADWQEALANKPPKELLSEVSAAGFDGIYIDRTGYPDHAARLERRLSRLLGAEPRVSPNEDMSFFSLVPYKEDL
jgi:phosphoglycerol transferase